MTANALVHRITVKDQMAVETIDQLIEVLRDFGGAEFLDKSYLVEIVGEELSDKSVVTSVRIRPEDTAAWHFGLPPAPSNREE